MEQASIRSGRSEIRLSGVVSYLGRGLALTGAVIDTQADPASEAKPTGFFVGGTWFEPFVSPAAVTPKLN